MAIGEQALFQLDDSAEPGLVRVRLLGKARIVAGRQIWKVEVLEVVKPSFRRVKVGQKLEVAETLLQFQG